MKLKNALKKLNACSEAIEWVDDKTMSKAWAECKRPDWMLWYLAYKIDRKRLVGIAAKCARTSLHVFEEKYPNDKRVRECLDACEKYSNGLITLEELKKYRCAAYAADAADDDAFYAARAAFYAADAADDDAFYAARAAAVAAVAADYAAYANDDVRKKMCAIIRREVKVSELLGRKRGSIMHTIEPGDVFEVMNNDWYRARKGNNFIVLSQEKDIYPVAVMRGYKRGMPTFEDSLQETDILKHKFIFNLYDKLKKGE